MVMYAYYSNTLDSRFSQSQWILYIGLTALLGCSTTCLLTRCFAASARLQTWSVDGGILNY
jgi:hypothetical protein